METIKSIYSDENLCPYLDKSETSYDGVLNDFHEGEAFKMNPFFQENKNAIEVILYQDAFEIVNPIGPAANKHKILTVYMTLGNLPDYKRTHIDNIYLVALIKTR